VYNADICLYCRSFIEESHAGIKISPLDTKFFGLTDRLVTVTGTLEEQMHAIDLILSKLTDDPHYSQTMHAPFSYAGVTIAINFLLSNVLFLLEEKASSFYLHLYIFFSYHVLLVLYEFINLVIPMINGSIMM
jgi:hypothetical protein